MSRTLRLVIIFGVIICGSVPALKAQWVYCGPRGGSVTSFAFLDQSLFASTRGGGVFESSDSGGTWVPMNIGLTDTNVSSLLAINGTLIASTDSTGIFASTNNGVNWISVNSGLTSHHIISLVSLGTVLFVGTQDSGIFRSADEGAHWMSVAFGLTSKSITFLSAAGTELFTQTSSLYHSMDSGNSWVNISKGLSAKVTSVVSAGGYFFAATNAGVFRTSDEGRNWEGPDTAGLFGYSAGIATFIAVDSTLFSSTANGLFESSSYGVTWTQLNQDNSFLPVNTFFVFDSIFFGGNSEGAWRSDNQGRNFTQSNHGMVLFQLGLYQKGIAGIVYLGNTINAYNSDSIYSSSDNGDHWILHAAPQGGLNTIAAINSFAYAGTDSNGILRSTDNGITWTTLNGMTNVYPVGSIVSTDNAIFAGTNGIFPQDAGGGIFRSTDNGKTWIQIELSGYSNPNEAQVAANGKDVFVRIESEPGSWIFRSTDEGSTWITMLSTDSYTRIGSLLCNDAYVFLTSGSGYGLSRSPIDTGIWTYLRYQDSNTTSYQAISGMIATDSIMLIGTNLGIFHSSNNGDNWDSSGSIKSINSFCIGGGFVFAESSDIGMWRRPLSQFPVGVPASIATIIPKEDFEIEPNPTTGLITIHGAIGVVTVTNVLGVDVQEVPNPHSSEITLDLTNQPPGTYFVRINAPNRIVMWKIIKQ